MHHNEEYLKLKFHWFQKTRSIWVTERKKEFLVSLSNYFKSLNGHFLSNFEMLVVQKKSSKTSMESKPDIEESNPEVVERGCNFKSAGPDSVKNAVSRAQDFRRRKDKSVLLVRKFELLSISHTPNFKATLYWKARTFYIHLCFSYKINRTSRESLRMY